MNHPVPGLSITSGESDGVATLDIIRATTQHYSRQHNGEEREPDLIA
ncbi:hypothetical protein [Microvirga sp. P5_D2]